MPATHADDIARGVGYRLYDNGLQLTWEEDHRQPLVALEVRIKGGLRAEGPYLGTGITHAIEHMLFKGTPTRPAGTIDQEVRRYGGTINAFTSLDATGVSLFVESRYLPEALDLLADILQHAVFDPAEFEKERAVIVSEIQMNLDDPNRRLHHLFWERHFLEHPYRHPILGYRSRLEALSAQDLAALYAAQYHPQQIVLSCVGDLDGAALPQLVKERFGGWPRGAVDPLQQVVAAEPPAVSPRRVAVEMPVQSTYALLGVSTTRLADPDLYALDVLASILGKGKSSRLYERIVRRQRLADGISAWNHTPYDPGVLGVQLLTDAPRLEQALEAVVAEWEALIRGGVTEAELRKAKQQVRAEYLLGLQTMESRAGDLANSLLLTGDPLFSRRYVEGIARVTAEQVQQAAARYLDAGRMTTAVIQPAAAAAPQAPAAVTQGMALEKTILPNGATILIGVDRTLPLAAVVAGLRGGVRVEDARTQGLSNLASLMLTKGTKRRDAPAIASFVESLGGSLQSFSGRDEFGLALELLAEDVEPGMALVHELLTGSTFPEEELAIQRDLVLKQLQVQEDEIFQVGADLLRAALFPSHPYRFNPLGEPETLRGLSRGDCAAFATRWITPGNLVVGVTGDVDAAAVRRSLERTIGALRPAASPWPERVSAEPLEGVRETTKTFEREQALILLGFRAPTYRSQDREAVDVLTAVLSGMAGRLFQAVREAQGLSYALGAAHAPGWDPGYLLIYAATKPQEQRQTLETIEEQLRRIADEPPGEEEIEQARRYLIGAHRLDIQELGGLTKRAVIEELRGIGYDAWQQYEARIRSVTAQAVQDAARRYLTLQRRAQVLVSPQVNGRPH